MMFIGKRIIVVAALALLVTTCFAQRRFGFGGPQMGVMLLSRDDVKDDLKLTDDQKTKLLDLQDRMTAKFREMFQNGGGPGADRTKMAADMKAISDDATKEANTILTADQQVRLKQIGIQLSGYGAATVPEIQAELKLTEDQKTKIAELQKTQQAANASIREKIQSGELDREDAGPLMKKNSDALNEEIGKLLTDDQKAQLKKMGGPTFTPSPPSAR